MKYKTGLRAITCFMMVAAMLFLTIPSFSRAELSDNDKDKLLAFWEQTDPEGIMCNGDRAFDFGVGDVNILFGATEYVPGSWYTRLVEYGYTQDGDTLYCDSFKLNLGFYLEFNFVDDTPIGPIAVDAYDYIFPDLYGPLDLAGTSITSLGDSIGVPDESVTHIESVKLDNCANLEKIYFRDQKFCTSLSAVNCPKLERVSTTDCDYKSINVQPKGYDNPLNISAVCDGNVGADFTYSPDGSTMTVYADSEERSFLGWYCNGDLVSTELEFNYNGTGKLTACFGGDADGDGVLSMKDSVIMSRIALGLKASTVDVETLDADRNGSLAIADSVIIARIVLGV